MIEPSPDALPEDVEIERLARARRQARGLRVAARRALALARRYREEEGPQGRREIACVAQALTWRTAAHALHKATASELGNAARSGPSNENAPGLARTSGPASEANRRAG
jgi:hypothetical protein